MKRLLAGLAVSVSVLCVLGHQAAQATPIATDSFDSYVGDIGGGAGGSGWTSDWAAASSNTQAQSTNILSYSAGAVSVDGGTQSVQHVDDNNNPQVSRSFAPQSGVVYFSLLMQLPTSADNEYVGFHFTDSNNGGLDNTPSAEIGLYGGGGSTGFVRAGVTDPSNNRGLDSEPYTNGDTFFVVGRISDEGPDGTAGEYDRLELFINPTSLTEPPVATRTADRASTMMSLDTFAVRTANFAAGESVVFDELRIGTSYADVVVAVPEPASVVLLMLATTGVAVLVRKRG